MESKHSVACGSYSGDRSFQSLLELLGLKVAGEGLGVLFGYFFMIFGSLGARASQSVSPSVSRSANRAVRQSPSRSSSGSGESVSQSARLPIEPSISQSGS